MLLTGSISSYIENYSTFILPPTLRAVQGANPYVRTWMNSIRLATFKSPDSLAGRDLIHFRFRQAATLHFCKERGSHPHLLLRMETPYYWAILEPKPTRAASRSLTFWARICDAPDDLSLRYLIGFGDAG